MLKTIPLLLKRNTITCLHILAYQLSTGYPNSIKRPTEFRFITSGRHTVINTLSKKIAIGLQSMLKLEKTQCKFNHKFDGIKNDYIIDSNKEVIDFMIVSNLLNPGNKYIKTFDFKTLYTKIPHNKLKKI